MSTYNNDAWELLQEWVEAQPSVPGRVWIPQPEPCPAFEATLKLLPKDNVEILQSFRPAYTALTDRGFQPKQTPGGPYSRVLFVPTRQRIESLGTIAHALLNLTPDGSLVFACANAQGASGYLSRLREVSANLEAESGNKCRFTVIQAGDILHREILKQWAQEAGDTRVAGTDFHTVPGIFGWNKIDRGSELLLSTLPELAGVGADFGAGYGYLSHGVLQKSLVELHVVEAEARALDCARKNLAKWDSKTQFHWLDVSDMETRKSLPDLDWVVMNPPFHEGRDVESSLGKAFIETAFAKLKPGGHLYLVANQFLAYEKTLNAYFQRSEKILEADGFKVIHAQR